MIQEFKTDNFTFKSYKSDDIIQNKAIEILDNDELTNKFYSMWKNIIKLYDNIDVYYFYFAYLENKIVGIITMVRDNNKAVFSHAILPEYRGKRLSSKIKSEVIEYLSNNTDIDKLICYIDKNNNNSISSMIKTNPDEINPVQKDDSKIQVIYNLKNKNKSYK